MVSETLTSREVVDILKISRSTRHLWLKAGTLKGDTVGHRWLFKLRTALSLVALLAVVGCAAAPVTPPPPPAKAVFSRPFEEVWRAGLEALRATRYPVVALEKEQGVIRTGWRWFLGFSSTFRSEDRRVKLTMHFQREEAETVVEVAAEGELLLRSQLRGMQVTPLPFDQLRKREMEVLIQMIKALGQ